MVAAIVHAMTRRGSPQRAARPRPLAPRGRPECELVEDDGVVAFSFTGKGPKAASFTLFMPSSAFTRVKRLFADFHVRGEDEPQTLPLEDAEVIVRKAG